jgi:nitroimidazol reductase NimA-like FMN-containing flavoprotein (pyridoxamine 5'-phosphate oxidase superfamily)
MSDDLADRVRAVIDANRYMVLATADETGHPWVTPVWFATEDYRSFHWVSSPEAKHSLNLAAQPRSRSRSSIRPSRSGARRRRT